MLLVGSVTSRTCSGLTRRALLQVGGSSALGLSLAAALRAEAAGPEGKADSCILLFLNGGPSHPHAAALATFVSEPVAGSMMRISRSLVVRPRSFESGDQCTRLSWRPMSVVSRFGFCPSACAT